MHFKWKSHEENDKCEHIVLSLKDVDKNNIDEAFYLISIEQKKFDYYLLKCHFKLVFNIYKNSPFIMSKVSDNKTMISRKNFVEKVIEDFTDKWYKFNHIQELHIMTTANKLDITYDFNIQHKMHAIEWKLNKLLNKNPNLINKFNKNWRHPMIRKLENYRV